jgi:NYN domain
MGREELERLSGGGIRRRTKRRAGLFIDASGLDRATRRLEKKVDLSRLVSGLVSGIQIEVSKYYCLIPNEDDARQFSFLDAVERAGIEVVTKRLPPKGVMRQVSMDVHMATDLMSFVFGQFENPKQVKPDQQNEEESTESSKTTENKSEERAIKRIATVVCPSRELSYALYVASTLGVEVALADFGLYGTSDGWKGIDRWIDLSTSETIWR